MSRKYQVIDLLHQSILELCKVTVPTQHPYQVDGILCITLGTDEELVVKVHQTLGIKSTIHVDSASDEDPKSHAKPEGAFVTEVKINGDTSFKLETEREEHGTGDSVDLINASLLQNNIVHSSEDVALYKGRSNVIPGEGNTGGQDTSDSFTTEDFKSEESEWKEKPTEEQPQSSPKKVTGSSLLDPVFDEDSLDCRPLPMDAYDDDDDENTQAFESSQGMEVDTLDNTNVEKAPEESSEQSSDQVNLNTLEETQTNNESSMDEAPAQILNDISSRATTESLPVNEESCSKQMDISVDVGTSSQSEQQASIQEEGNEHDKNEIITEQVGMENTSIAPEINQLLSTQDPDLDPDILKTTNSTEGIQAEAPLSNEETLPEVSSVSISSIADPEESSANIDSQLKGNLECPLEASEVEPGAQDISNEQPHLLSERETEEMAAEIASAALAAAKALRDDQSESISSVSMACASESRVLDPDNSEKKAHAGDELKRDIVEHDVAQGGAPEDTPSGMADKMPPTEDIPSEQFDVIGTLRVETTEDKEAQEQLTTGVKSTESSAAQLPVSTVDTSYSVNSETQPPSEIVNIVSLSSNDVQSVGGGNSAVAQSTSLKCKECGVEMPSVGALKEHNQSFHGLFTCDVCRNSYKHKINYDLHILSHKNKQNSKANTGNVREKASPITTVNYQKQLKCGICGFLHNQMNGLIEHLRSTHEYWMFLSCLLCGEYFPNEHTFGIHRKFAHENITQNKCSICQHGFLSHEVSTHRLQCGKRVSNPSSASQQKMITPPRAKKSNKSDDVEIIGIEMSPQRHQRTTASANMSGGQMVPPSSPRVQRSPQMVARYAPVYAQGSPQTRHPIYSPIPQHGLSPRQHQQPGFIRHPQMLPVNQRQPFSSPRQRFSVPQRLPAASPRQLNMSPRVVSPMVPQNRSNVPTTPSARTRLSDRYPQAVGGSGSKEQPINIDMEDDIAIVSASDTRKQGTLLAMQLLSQHGLLPANATSGSHTSTNARVTQQTASSNPSPAHVVQRNDPESSPLKISSVYSINNAAEAPTGLIDIRPVAEDNIPVSADPPFHCQSCEHTFTDYRAFAKHNINIHNTCVCSVCYNTLPDNDALLQHMQQYHNS